METLLLGQIEGARCPYTENSGGLCRIEGFGKGERGDETYGRTDFFSEEIIVRDDFSLEQQRSTGHRWK